MENLHKIVKARHLAAHTFEPAQSVILYDKRRSCDLFPVGSIHRITLDENGTRWLQDRIDAIPSDYPVLPINATAVHTKNCSHCGNLFLGTHVFNELGQCVRCTQKDKTNKN